MAQLTLAVGNKNYSSWSLRAWLALKHLGVEFTEVVIPLDQPGTHEQIDRYGPSGRLPALRAGELVVWDSLAICEYAAELTGRGWPRATEARALARSIAAEMHAGFPNLRALWPMNARARNRRTAMTAALAADIERIDEIWNDCRHRFGSGGPWLFGPDYSIADAMYAPVVSRFCTYGVPCDQTCADYSEAVWSLPAFQEWLAAARKETYPAPDHERDAPPEI